MSAWARPITHGNPRRTCYRDKVGFMVRVRFAGAVPKTRWLEIGFWLARRANSPRFHKIETISPSAHVHLLRVGALEGLDAEVAAWIKEAYAVPAVAEDDVRSGWAAPPAPGWRSGTRCSRR